MLNSIETLLRSIGLQGELVLFRESHNSTLFKIEDVIVRICSNYGSAHSDVMASKIDLRLPETFFMECLFGPLNSDGFTVTGWRWVDKTKDTDLRDIAKFAAGMFGVQHLDTTSSRIVIERVRKYVDMVEMSTLASNAEKQLLKKSFQKASEIWFRLDKNNVGLVHGDLSTENVIVSGGNLVGIDLETCGYGPQAWDMVQVVGASIYGVDESDIQDAVGCYQNAGGKANMEDTQELVFVMMLAGAAWATAFRHLSEGHMEQSYVRLKALAGDWQNAPQWTLL